jgi:hypothetical protein
MLITIAGTGQTIAGATDRAKLYYSGNDRY